MTAATETTRNSNALLARYSWSSLMPCCKALNDEFYDQNVHTVKVWYTIKIKTVVIYTWHLLFVAVHMLLCNYSQLANLDWMEPASLINNIYKG